MSNARSQHAQNKSSDFYPHETAIKPKALVPIARCRMPAPPFGALLVAVPQTLDKLPRC